MAKPFGAFRAPQKYCLSYNDVKMKLQSEYLYKKICQIEILCLSLCVIIVTIWKEKERLHALTVCSASGSMTCICASTTTCRCL